MKISIITPSLNSEKTIERAITSILNQNYSDFEHIIVDGGSKDKTINIIKKYKHIKYVSEKDRNQVHAMNKGFKMSSGSIIGYLNSDDYYTDETFKTISDHFLKGEKVVMGNVLVKTETQSGIIEWLCNPKNDFYSAIKHWENNAFCVNPVGYFYLREIQEKYPYNESLGAKHDLDFLIFLSKNYSIKKLDCVFGVFNNSLNTQTAKEQLYPSYWEKEKFKFLDSYIDNLDEQEKQNFRELQVIGYQSRRHKIIKNAIMSNNVEELLTLKEAFLLPSNDEKSKIIASIYDTIIVIIGDDEFLATVVNKILSKNDKTHYLKYEINCEEDNIQNSLCNNPLFKELAKFYRENNKYFKWKIYCKKIDNVCTIDNYLIFLNFKTNTQINYVSKDKNNIFAIETINLAKIENEIISETNIDLRKNNNTQPNNLISIISEHISKIQSEWNKIEDNYPSNYQDLNEKSKALIKHLHLLQDTNAIDIGCNSGMYTLLAARFCNSIIGTDTNKSMIERACIAKNYFENNIYSAHNTKFHLGNFADCLNSKINSVIASLVLYHIGDENVKILGNFINKNCNKIIIQARPQRDKAFEKNKHWMTVSNTKLYNGLYKIEDCLNFLRDNGFNDAKVLSMNTFYHEYFPIIYAEK